MSASGQVTPSQPSASAALHQYTFADTANLADDIRTHLTKAADWASGLLDTLTSNQDENGMPGGVLNACEGLAFLSCGKGGFGITYASGAGFVIRKLDQDAHGHSLWSAPMFIKAHQLGLGITAGYEHVDSCMALMNLSTIHGFAEKHVIAGTDLGFFSTAGATSGMPAGTIGNMAQLEIAADNQTNVFCYSSAHGALINLSINGTETLPDHHWNDLLYGKDANHVQDVLAGRVPTFEEMLPLYRKIQALAVKAI